MISTLCCLALLQGPDWRHVVPQPGSRNEHAPPRAIPLVTQLPEGVAEEVQYSGHRHRYLQLRFGSAGTTRIAIAADELENGKHALYVDGDRDRKLTASDRVPGDGPVWRLPLELARTDGVDVEYVTRPAYFRLHSATMAFAPIGYVEGTTRLGERTVMVRRVDADGNASYSDPKDRLLVDVDGDGHFDSYDEVFLYAPVLKIRGDRWIVREDLAGDGVTFAKLEGTGSLQLTADGAKGLRSLRVTLQSKDGVTVGVDALGAKVEAPVGTYRVVNVDVSFDDPKGGAPWGFIFSAEGEAKRWHTVGKDETTRVDPLSGLGLDVGLQSEAGIRGEFVHLQPRLTTADGLLINSCWRGQHTGFGHFGPSASIRLVDARGSQLDTAKSGFA